MYVCEGWNGVGWLRVGRDEKGIEENLIRGF